uniref:Coiled-coil domain-containing protein n=1 Tax=Amblyomma aureolatum TaxID=187763 RepID=A0A1E1XJ63_9ACAR
MADAQPSEEQAVVPEGRVEKVCKEWLVREDGVLAYRLQSQEINQRYNLNRTNNQVLRADLPVAKTVQRSEEEEADFIRRTYEEMLRQQEEHDAKVAMELQQQLQREAALHAAAQEEDQRVALELQRRELPKKMDRIERRRKDDALPTVLKRLSLGEDASGAFYDDSDSRDEDFSDFCLQPPPGLAGEDLKKFQEEQDAELARLLQEQETKRRGASANDRQIAMEAQDRELAKMLQDQEKARLRRARERARQKALLQQQQQQQQQMSSAEELDTGGQHASSGDSSREHLENSSLAKADGEPVGATAFLVGPTGVKNIATEIDPTFSRRKPSLERQGSGRRSNSRSPHNTLDPLADTADTKTPPGTIAESSATMGGSTSSPALANACYADLDDGEGAVPPYMPIQGQRRSSSFEKGKKGKKAKDACKTQ